jgi:EthD domain
MIKLMTLIRSPVAVEADEFKAYWSGEFFSRLSRLSIVQDHLVRALHNHVLPAPIREEVTAATAPTYKWAGAGCYYFDSRVMAEAFLASSEYRTLLADSRATLAKTAHLLVDEVWMYNRDPGDLPIKAFAFFKRAPHLSRLQCLQYYQGPHAAVGASVNKGRTVRYIQNHVLLDFQTPPAFDYDGGPEIWLKSMSTAMDLYADREAMETLARDEAKFVVPNDLIHFLAEEDTMLERG